MVLLLVGSYTIVLLWALSSASDECTDDGYHVVDIQDGKTLGEKRTTKDSNQTFYAFKGIPYAAPPIGDLRFKSPRPPARWTHIKDCTKDRPSCHQPPGASGLSSMSEDCLYLNVYTPNVKTKKKLCTMVYFHGGSFVTGSGNEASCGPDFWMELDVVLVTCNYRLDVFGFLSLGNGSTVPGNAGLKDQALVLQWVHDNIRSFGGDPEQVTIFGEGAGSTSVLLHRMSTYSKGLFNATIEASGSRTVWSVRTDVGHYSKLLAEKMNCSSSDIRDKEECMRKIHPADLINGAEEIRLQNPLYGTEVFVPCIEEGSEHPFIPKKIDLKKDKPGSLVPTLIGVNSHEGLVKSPDFNRTEDIEKNLIYIIPEDVRTQLSESRKQQIKEDLKKKYFKNTTDLWGYINMRSDYCKYSAVQTAIHLHEKNISVHLFFWELEKLQNITYTGHGEDLNYFWVRDRDNGTTDSPEIRKRRKMAKMCANFAKDKNPTPADDPDLDGVIWRPVRHDSTNYLHIDKTLTMEKDDMCRDAVSFWKKIDRPEPNNCNHS